MARIAKLKETTYHSDIFIGVFKSIDVYETKEELKGENALCIALDNNKVGYIPLTTNDTRGGVIHVIGKDDVVYRLARQKKGIWEDIAYCKFAVELNGSGFNSMGDNYIQTSISGSTSTAYIQATPSFYNIYNEKIDHVMNYIEEAPEMIFYLNAYMTSSGSGNTYYFAHRVNTSIISGTLGSYTNTDVNVNYVFNNTTANDNRMFQIGAKTPNAYNSNLVKMTFKKLTIGGRDIPIILEKKS